MDSFKVLPILGLKTDVPQDDLTLFQGNACHCVEMANVDMGRQRMASTKSFGVDQYSTPVIASYGVCQGLFEIIGSTQTDNIFFDHGKFYYLDTLALTNVDAAAPVSFGTDDGKQMSVIQVGDYAIFTDSDKTLTPYKWKNGDANLTKFIQTGTEYKFKYLCPFQRRIIGAYSDQTNGDIEIRWTQDWTSSNYWASAATFAAANQLYKPDNDKITGIKNFGTNTCFLYGDNSISAIDYLGNYLMPFGIRTLVNNHGCSSNASIVDIGTAHFLFNKNYGFCSYLGGSQFPANGKPLSEDIEDVIASIDPRYYDRIVGKFIPTKSSVCWAVPINYASTPNILLFFNILTGQWWSKVIETRAIDFWTIVSTLKWTDLAGLGYSLWEDFGMMRWKELFTNTPVMVHGNADGFLYVHSGESNNGNSWNGYRVEPIMSLGDTNRALLLEIWFGLSSVGDFNLYVQYRGGDTVGECEASTWVSLDNVSVNSPDNAVCYLSKNNRYHQIKWGTSGKNETFAVNSIEFKYVPQASY